MTCLYFCNPIKRAGLCLLFFLVLAGQAFADYDYINISDPFHTKIPLAVPLAVSLSGDPETDSLSEQATELLRRSVDFTGYFKMIDERAFLEGPGERGISARDVNFGNWRDIGAELLITSGIRLEGRVLQLEFRLFDPFRQELLFGKRYTGEVAGLRDMVLKFCDEMIYRLTGRFGSFNTKIAFVSETENGKALYVCDFDGENLRRVTDKETIISAPSWSPDGRYIAYTSYKNDRPQIFIRSMETGREELFAGYEGLNITPAWVPGGSGIAATLSFEGDEEIYLLTQTGEIDKRLTRSWGVDVSPTFSPEGDKMAFVSGRSGSPQIYVMDLESGRTRRLTYEGSYNTQPDWSPAGDRIAYSGMEDGESNIFVINADGSELKRLTRHSGRNESPGWSPDGNMIVFSSTRGNSANIFVMTASGAEQRPILEMPENQSLPDWSPVIEP